MDQLLGGLILDQETKEKVELVQCPSCKHFAQHHSLDCDTLSVEEQLEKYKDAYNRSCANERRTNQWAVKAHEQTVLWMGKYRLVKHENNKLRTKIYNQMELKFYRERYGAEWELHMASVFASLKAAGGKEE